MQSVLNLKSAPSNNKRIKERKKGALHPSARNFIQSEVSIYSINLKQLDLLQDRRARNIAFHLTLQKRQTRKYAIVTFISIILVGDGDSTPVLIQKL